MVGLVGDHLDPAVRQLHLVLPLGEVAGGVLHVAVVVPGVVVVHLVAVLVILLMVRLLVMAVWVNNQTATQITEERKEEDGGTLDIMASHGCSVRYKTVVGVDGVVVVAVVSCHDQQLFPASAVTSLQSTQSGDDVATSSHQSGRQPTSATMSPWEICTTGNTHWDCSARKCQHLLFLNY